MRMRNSSVAVIGLAARPAARLTAYYRAPWLRSRWDGHANGGVAPALPGMAGEAVNSPALAVIPWLSRLARLLDGVPLGTADLVAGGGARECHPDLAGRAAPDGRG